MKISFIGLGKLGLPCALAIESRGHEVKGIDMQSHIKEYLIRKQVPYKEEGIEGYLAKTKIEFISTREIVEWSDIIFVAVQTPHHENYEGITRLPKERVDFEYTHLQSSIYELNEIAGSMKKNPVVSVISTVLPGTMDRSVLPYANNLMIVYNPFFIAMGTIIKDFLNPEFVLLGVNNKYAASKMTVFYKNVLDSRNAISKDHRVYPTVPEIFECSIKSAEAIKVLYNTYISQKIVWANAAMELCHHTGADVDTVSDAMALATKRIISPMYMRAGMGDGGGCHPRDCIALSYIARKHHISYDWWGNLMLAREAQTEWLVDLIVSYWNEHGFNLDKIVIMGKAFKPETNLTYGSPAILLYNILCEKVDKKHIEVFDPYVDDHEEGQSEEWRPCLFFIGTKHPFQNLPWGKGSIVIDPWRYIPDQEGIKVIRIGEGK